MNIKPTRLAGVSLIQLPHFADERGSFTKLLHGSSFKHAGLDHDFVECFYSTSAKNVLRGMHLQLPPHEHHKLVHVVSGKILDVVVDIRPNSETFGQYASFYLNEKKPEALHIEKGFAHGFLTLSNSATVCYLTTTEHHPELDSGVAWNSFDFDWPTNNPIISIRDSSLPTLSSLKKET